MERKTVDEGKKRREWKDRVSWVESRRDKRKRGKGTLLGRLYIEGKDKTKRRGETCRYRSN